MNFINKFQELITYLENRPSQAMSVAPLPEIDQRIQALVRSTPSTLAYAEMIEVNRLKSAFEVAIGGDVRLDEAIARIRLVAPLTTLKRKEIENKDDEPPFKKQFDLNSSPTDPILPVSTEKMTGAGVKKDKRLISCFESSGNTHSRLNEILSPSDYMTLAQVNRMIHDYIVTKPHYSAIKAVHVAKTILQFADYPSVLQKLLKKVFFISAKIEQSILEEIKSPLKTTEDYRQLFKVAISLKTTLALLNSDPNFKAQSDIEFLIAAIKTIENKFIGDFMLYHHLLNFGEVGGKLTIPEEQDNLDSILYSIRTLLNEERPYNVADFFRTNLIGAINSQLFNDPKTWIEILKVDYKYLHLLPSTFAKHYRHIILETLKGGGIFTDSTNRDTFASRFNSDVDLPRLVKTNPSLARCFLSPTLAAEIIRSGVTKPEIWIFNCNHSLSAEAGAEFMRENEQVSAELTPTSEVRLCHTPQVQGAILDRCEILLADPLVPFRVNFSVTSEDQLILNSNEFEQLFKRIIPEKVPDKPRLERMTKLAESKGYSLDNRYLELASAGTVTENKGEFPNDENNTNEETVRSAATQALISKLLDDPNAFKYSDFHYTKVNWYAVFAGFDINQPRITQSTRIAVCDAFYFMLNFKGIKITTEDIVENSFFQYIFEMPEFLLSVQKFKVTKDNSRIRDDRTWIGKVNDCLWIMPLIKFYQTSAHAHYPPAIKKEIDNIYFTTVIDALKTDPAWFQYVDPVYRQRPEVLGLVDEHAASENSMINVKYAAELREDCLKDVDTNFVNCSDAMILAKIRKFVFSTPLDQHEEFLEEAIPLVQSTNPYLWEALLNPAPNLLDYDTAEWIEQNNRVLLKLIEDRREHEEGIPDIDIQVLVNDRALFKQVFLCFSSDAQLTNFKHLDEWTKDDIRSWVESQNSE